MDSEIKKYILNILSNHKTSILCNWEYEEQGADYEKAQQAYNAVLKL